MQPFPYRILVEWSAPDEAYVARVPALPGCAAHGESEAEAAHEARVAAEGILGAMRDHKRALPPSDAVADYSGNIRLRLPRTLHAELARRADAEGVSLNALMVSMLSRAS
jgi:antitoxin HicB